jgi:hypothetical protein
VAPGPPHPPSYVLKACGVEDERTAKLMNKVGPAIATNPFIGNFVALAGLDGFGNLHVTHAAPRRSVMGLMELVPGITVRRFINDGGVQLSRCDLTAFVFDSLSAITYIASKAGNQNLNDLHSDNMMAATAAEMREAMRATRRTCMHYTMIDIGLTRNNDFTTQFTQIVAPSDFVEYFNWCRTLERLCSKAKLEDGAFGSKLATWACRVGAMFADESAVGARNAGEALRNLFKFELANPPNLNQVVTVVKGTNERPGRGLN